MSRSRTGGSWLWSHRRSGEEVRCGVWKSGKLFNVCSMISSVLRDLNLDPGASGDQSSPELMVFGVWPKALLKVTSQRIKYTCSLNWLDSFEGD